MGCGLDSREAADARSASITAFDDLRKRIVNLNNDRDIAIADLIAYLRMLTSLSTRFVY